MLTAPSPPTLSMLPALTPKGGGGLSLGLCLGSQFPAAAAAADERHPGGAWGNRDRVRQFRSCRLHPLGSKPSIQTPKPAQPSIVQPLLAGWLAGCYGDQRMEGLFACAIFFMPSDD